MDDKVLITINGGTTISGTLINSIAKLIGMFLEIGRTIGSSIRRAVNHNKC